MNCPQCGDPLPETRVVCPRCGGDIGWWIRKPDGTEYGPYDLATRDLCIRESRLVPGDMVRLGAQGQYESAQHLLGDRLTLPPAPQPYYAPAVVAPPSVPGDPARTCAVVVGVLVLAGAAVMAMMLPVSIRSRARARQASCMTNLKQIDMALIMYCQDYGERYPTEGQWEPKLWPYTKNTSIWTCPAYPREEGYRANQRLAGTRLFDVARPAETVSFVEAGVHGPGLSPPAGTHSPRHFGGDDFAFADGHVKWFRTPPLPGHLDPREAPPPPWRGP